MSTLRLGTRGSRLALAQSTMVARQLEAAHPGLTVELVEIRTAGDRIQDVPLGPELGQSFFTKEIEDALLDGASTSRSIRARIWRRRSPRASPSAPSPCERTRTTRS